MLYFFSPLIHYPCGQLLNYGSMFFLRVNRIYENYLVENWNQHRFCLNLPINRQINGFNEIFTAFNRNLSNTNP